MNPGYVKDADKLVLGYVLVFVYVNLMLSKFNFVEQVYIQCMDVFKVQIVCEFNLEKNGFLSCCNCWKLLFISTITCMKSFYLKIQLQFLFTLENRFIRSRNTKRGNGYDISLWSLFSVRALLFRSTHCYSFPSFGNRNR